jgi:hypothetical protein
MAGFGREKGELERIKTEGQQLAVAGNTEAKDVSRGGAEKRKRKGWTGNGKEQTETWV